MNPLPGHAGEEHAKDVKPYPAAGEHLEVSTVNPWKQNILEVLRSILRFTLWVGLIANGVMLVVFSIFFTHRFLRHLWTWCDRVLFPGSW